MIIHADLDRATVTLVDPADFRGFHVAVAGGSTDDGRLADLLAPHGRLEGDHAWITSEAVVALAGPAADDEWQAGFDGMVAYARDKGFLDESGAAIRAHLELRVTLRSGAKQHAPPAASAEPAKRRRSDVTVPGAGFEPARPVRARGG